MLDQSTRMFLLTNQVLADIGLPMVAVYLPPAWLALGPIIFIESGYGTWRFKFSFGRALAAQTTANCLSALIGIPMTWLVLVLVQLTVLEWGSRVLPKAVVSTLTPVLGAAWLSPVPDQGWWIVAIAVAVLTVVFYLMSVATEGFVVSRFFRDIPRKTIRSWMLQANAITYVLLLLLIFGAQFVPKVSEPAFQIMRPVSEGIVEMVFWTVGQFSGERKKDPPLIRAIEAGDVKKVQQLIAKGIDVNQRNDVGFPALSIAAGRGDENVTKLLLNAGANVNARSTTLNDTALARAAQNGNGPTVRALLAAGAHVDDRDGAGWTPLYNAALKGDPDIIDALLDAGANVNARSPTGWTALKEAQMRGDKSIADHLIKAGAIDYPDGSRR